MLGVRTQQGKENGAAPGGKKGQAGLATLFAEGSNAIATHRSQDLFKQLESRELTQDEQAIIQSRVREIQTVCPQVTQADALRALELCSGREEEAAAQLADPAFLQQVRASLGLAAGSQAGAEPLAARTNARPALQRPKKAEPAACSDMVFVGTFRGRGFPSLSAAPHAGRPGLPQRPSSARSFAAAEAAAQDADSEQTQSIGEGLPDDGMQEAGAAAESACPAADAPDSPASKLTAATGASSPQPYGLMRELSDGTLRPATESEAARALRAVGRSETPSIAPKRPGSGSALASASSLGTRQATSSRRDRLAAISEAGHRPAEEQDAGNEAAAKSENGAGAPVQQMPAAEQREQPQPAANGHACAVKGAGRQQDRPGSSTARTRAAQEAAKRASHGAVEASEQEDSWQTQGTMDDEETETDDDFVPAKGAKMASSTRGGALKRACSMSKAAARPGTGASKQRGAAKQVGAPAAKLAAPAAPNGKRSASEVAVPPPEASAALHSSGEEGGGAAPARQRAAKAKPAAVVGGSARRVAGAISRSGHTLAGRVRQKSHKCAELVSAGALRAGPGWHNSGYIFPEGFASRVNFRSSLVLDALCVHECAILGPEGQFWPAPTFRVTAMDRPQEPLLAKSCTGCWSGVLKRINAEIEARRAAGEDLPPPPKTAIAGPEYFGLNQPEVQAAIEALDPEGLCADYWAGKAEREAAAAGLPPPERGQRAGRGASSGAGAARAGAGGGARRRCGKRGREDEGQEDEEAATGNGWSALGRAERYRNRCGDEGGPADDPENPLPGFIDPITLQPVVTPTISPLGHVMGLATWKVVLAESGLCPFTKTPLRWEACVVLTRSNIERYRERIKAT